jgi:hypothetical protein
MESHTLIIPELVIAELIIVNFEIAVLDLSMINTAYESLNIGPIIGVIGGDILMKYKATVSYSLKRLSFNVK